jgi:hypothetical protein
MYKDGNLQKVPFLQGRPRVKILLQEDSGPDNRLSNKRMTFQILYSHGGSNSRDVPPHGAHDRVHDE